MTTKKEIEEKLEKKAEKETKCWFNQWTKDQDADISEYFKSIWIDGFEAGKQEAEKEIIELQEIITNGLDAFNKRGKEIENLKQKLAEKDEEIKDKYWKQINEMEKEILKLEQQLSDERNKISEIIKKYNNVGISIESLKKIKEELLSQIKNSQQDKTCGDGDGRRKIVATTLISKDKTADTEELCSVSDDIKSGKCDSSLNSNNTTQKGGGKR